MRVSLNWLKEFVPTNLTPAELSGRLTMAGVEVEAIDEIRPDFEGVVVGKVLEIKSHPNADKLVLCEVDVGRPSSLRIVCGARNMSEGDKVPVALVGARLKDGTRVKKTKIRGESSEGMMCSERELGISEDHSGIMILPAEAPLGKSLDETFGLSDVVLELGVTPNRSDCLSVFGVAREVAAITGGGATLGDVRAAENEHDTASLTSVTIDDEVGCPRYAARVVSGVTIGPSPAWIQQRLAKAGLRPLNNVVDVTNYVLMELGHPLHAFDYNKLEENRIVVRRARSGESIVTLDGTSRELSEHMLVIADAEKPVAIAGIMGGANSEVTELTNTVLIESAYFDPATIRKTSKSLGLSTEASYRFERGADPEMAPVALDRAASLMAELCGGRVARGLVDEYPRKFAFPEIPLRFARMKRILGIEAPPDIAVSILQSLGFERLTSDSETVLVKVPSYRPDITAEIDLIEEVARIYGYEKIEASYPSDTTVMERGIEPPSLESQCKAILKSCGFTEIIAYSFGSPKDMADVQPNGGMLPIRMKNPLSEDASVLRTTLVPGILHTVQTNVKIGNKDLKVFETGKIYLPDKEHELPDERTYVCAAATGLPSPINWKHESKEVDFFDTKGVAETLLQTLGCARVETRKATHPGFHPGICADLLVDGNVIGKTGEIHPDILHKYELAQKVYLFEFDASLLESQGASSRRYEKPSRFPFSDRDMAIVVHQDVEASAIHSAIVQAAGPLLKHVVLFDLYRGEQIGENMKSLAFTLRFQSDERTLTDEEITNEFNRIVGALEESFDAKLRSR